VYRTAAGKTVLAVALPGRPWAVFTPHPS
jgi:hypothetical protein